MNNKVKFLRGTSDEYAVAEKDGDTIYFTTDDGKLYIGDKEVSGSDITIDDTLSNTSTNPVQNKVIKAAIDEKADKTVAMTTADGLMSAEDKAKLDGADDKYALKSEIPTSLPANGGNADTVGGHSVNTDVPENAVFTDTVPDLSEYAVKDEVPNIVCMSREEYNALSEKDPNTYYMVSDDTGEFNEPIILEVGSGKKYTSFVAAMTDASDIIDNTGLKVSINVYSGEYDVYSELGGDEYIAGIGEKLWYDILPVFSGDVVIRGIGNVTLKLEIPDDIKGAYYNQCNRVSVINNAEGSILVENITFVCKNCRYAIHDECGNNISAANTTHIIRNCRFYNSNTLCAIGVGCVSPHYKIENCYAENTKGCLFFHDWAVSTGGNLTVSNCVFESNSGDEMLLSANSNSTFDVFLSNNNFERLVINSVDATKYAKNIFRIIGVGNTIPNVTVAEGIENPYPIKLV